MKWRKLGLIYAPSGEQEWAKSHAFIPTAKLTKGGLLRVYFTSLDANKFGRIAFVDLNPQNPLEIVNLVTEPIFDLGELGTFDDSGVNASCVINNDGQEYLYYIGWQRTERVPYMLFTGLAISNSKGEGAGFRRYSQTPILDRTDSEPFSRSAPFVMKENNLFKIWYWSCINWSREENWIHYNNVINYAESADGIHWPNKGHVCIVADGINDYSVGRPWVVKDGSTYKMWYSIRSKSQPYRMGYAESKDGLNWERKDSLVGITRSESGWDSEMICFPCVVDAGGKRYMFYNGNRHGATGFGCAELISD